MAMLNNQEGIYSTSIAQKPADLQFTVIWDDLVSLHLPWVWPQVYVLHPKSWGLWHVMTMAIPWNQPQLDTK